MKLDAVILAAGPGSRMVELTRGRPKCLLPVGGHSLIWYAITGLKSIGVTRMIILVPDLHEQDVKQYCYKKFNSCKDLRLEFVSVSMKSDCGTAQSILDIRDKIRQDFIVYSCDSVIDLKALNALLNHYRLYDPMLSMLLSDQPKFFQPRPVPGRREKDHYMRDVIAIEPLDKLDLTAGSGFSTNKIVFLHSERDLATILKIKNRELALHPSLEVCSRFLDMHVYIFKRQALDFMAQNRDKTVLKGELIPYLISRQFSKIDEGDRIDDDDDEISAGLKQGSDYETELRERLEDFNPRHVVASNITNYLQKSRLVKPPECHALVVRDLVAYRVHTLGSYLDSNKEAKNILNAYNVETLNVVKGCVIGEETKVGEKCLVKGGSMGSNCKIGDKCKIINCVIMDNVEIESNVNLSECIVGSNSRIGQKCDLKSCVIGFRQVVPSGRKANSEVIIRDGYVIDLSDPLVANDE